jgi:hypothetical protein
MGMKSAVIQKDKLIPPSATDEEWEATLKDLIDNPAFTLAPPLSDAVISRESIYTREDEMI